MKIRKLLEKKSSKTRGGKGRSDGKGIVRFIVKSKFIENLSVVRFTSKNRVRGVIVRFWSTFFKNFLSSWGHSYISRTKCRLFSGSRTGLQVDSNSGEGYAGFSEKDENYWKSCCQKHTMNHLKTYYNHRKTHFLAKIRVKTPF